MKTKGKIAWNEMTVLCSCRCNVGLAMITQERASLVFCALNIFSFFIFFWVLERNPFFIQGSVFFSMFFFANITKKMFVYWFMYPCLYISQKARAIRSKKNIGVNVNTEVQL